MLVVFHAQESEKLHVTHNGVVVMNHSYVANPTWWNEFKISEGYSIKTHDDDPNGSFHRWKMDFSMIVIK